jgi:mono/diheme cytochrome c family protein
VPFTRQTLTTDLLTQRTPAAHAWAEKTFSTYLSAGQFVPTALDKETVVFPCFLGGAEWGGPAVDPLHGTLYVNANEAACVIALTENKPGRSSTGQRTYHNQCSICHGDTRAGSPPTYPSLIDVGKRISEADIESTIIGGKGRMPAFPNLQGEYMKALVKFLLTSQSELDKENNRAEDAAKLDDSTQNPETHGANLYQDKCATCHGEHREGKLPAFPSLTGVRERLSTEEVRARIRQGKGLMPPFSNLNDSDVIALVAYLTAESPADADPDRDALYSSTAEGAPMKYRITGSNDFIDPDGYPGITPPWGTLNAIDLNTGKYLWKIPLGEYPELAAQGLTNTGTENYGGPIVTRSGLLFIGATVYDKKFRAFDTSSGKLVWETTLPNAGVATPATYMVNHKQYVVIAAGGGKDPKSSSGSVYEAFTLP